MNVISAMWDHWWRRSRGGYTNTAYSLEGPPIATTSWSHEDGHELIRRNVGDEEAVFVICLNTGEEIPLPVDGCIRDEVTLVKLRLLDII